MTNEQKDILDRIELIIAPMENDIKELKEAQKKLIEAVTKFANLETKIEHYKVQSEEARKVIHKRVDKLEERIIRDEKLVNERQEKLFKILFWFGTFLITTLVGIIYKMMG